MACILHACFQVVHAILLVLQEDEDEDAEALDSGGGQGDDNQYHVGGHGRALVRCHG